MFHNVRLNYSLTISKYTIDETFTSDFFYHVYFVFECLSYNYVVSLFFPIRSMANSFTQGFVGRVFFL